MLAVVEISFLRPKNVGFFNSKLGWATDANQSIDCGLRNLCYFCPNLIKRRRLIYFHKYIKNDLPMRMLQNLKCSKCL